VNFTGSARRALPEICFLGRPSGEASARKLSRLKGASDCGLRVDFEHWDGSSEGAANERSRVALAEGVLIPGDSTRTQEKIWVRAFRKISQTRILVLGHHGSRTSTSKELMRTLNLNMAIASARFRRYGHPHREVRAQLQRARVPLLRTEDWGTIRIAL
jgi:competence protein ComEC